jgi:hypothetical protein
MVSPKKKRPALKKANIHFSLRNANEQMIHEHLTSAYKNYYLLKGSHEELHQAALENQAEAIAVYENFHIENVLKAIRGREKQRETAKKSESFGAKFPQVVLH